ncbi:TetR/AcrR family transcriptional regulator [Thalassolituus oleivorans]|uniref:TetR/AcrR family transcriptional regulator n=1 Tax=Thalassolituus oleivorans TaxID=187493 RepID=UPI0030C85DE6
MSSTLTRNRIVAEADRLFYEQGFEHTSFAQIAEALGISRGNFYYHFKTKDEILEAVISHRLDSTNAMLDNWELEGKTPADRIKSFINILVVNKAKITRYGCPVGTLCTELTKLNHPAQSHSNKLFSLFRTWLCRQFEQLNRINDADEFAMHLLSFSQGVASISNAFQDEAFIHKEISRINTWVDSLTNSPEP